jgi:hypothetical protein
MVEIIGPGSDEIGLRAPEVDAEGNITYFGHPDNYAGVQEQNAVSEAVASELGDIAIDDAEWDRLHTQGVNNFYDHQTLNERRR